MAMARRVLPTPWGQTASSSRLAAARWSGVASLAAPASGGAQGGHAQSPQGPSAKAGVHRTVAAADELPEGASAPARRGRAETVVGSSSRPQPAVRVHSSGCQSGPA